MSGGWVRRWLLVGLSTSLGGCGSGDASDGASGGRPTTGGGTAGTAGAGSGGSGGAGGTAGTGGVAGTGGTRIDCSDRSRPECQPTTIGPIDARNGPLTVLYRDVYWGPTLAGAGSKLLKTSLDTDQTTELPRPQFEDGLAYALFPGQYFVNDGSNVFIVSNYCCAGASNGVLRYDVASGSFIALNLGWAQDLQGAVHTSGSIAVFLGFTYLEFLSTADLTSQSIWRPPTGERLAMLGSDGSDVFMQLVIGDPPDTMLQIGRFDGSTIEPLSTSPESPYSVEGTLEVGEEQLYFPAGTKILSASRNSPGDPSTLVDLAPNHPLLLMVGDRSVYWVDETGIHGVASTGGNAFDLALFDNTFSAPTELRDIDQSDDYVVWTSPEGLKKVRK